MMRQMAPQIMLAAPHAAALGMQLVSMEPGEVVTFVPFQPDLIGNPETGVIAGGVVTALLDHTAGQSVMAALEAYISIATLDLRIDYMRAAGPGLGVYCSAKCYKITRSVAFVRATAYDQDPADPLATAQAVFMLNSNSAPTPAQVLAEAAAVKS